MYLRVRNAVLDPICYVDELRSALGFYMQTKGLADQYRVSLWLVGQVDAGDYFSCHFEARVKRPRANSGQ